jgi:hypothetical protein
VVTPETISFLGANDQVCGSGIADVIVTGGSPPYTASSTQPSLIAIQPTTLNQNGGSFSLTIFPGSLPNCLTGSVVVRDSTGRTATVTITTAKGTTPAVVPMGAQPNTICLPDGGSTPVLVIGGNNAKVVNVGNPGLVSVTPNNWSNQSQVVTVAAVGLAPLVPASGTGVTVIFYDGASQALLSVNRKTFCP